MQQLSEEWFKVRLGKLTGSRIKDAIATLKNGNRSEASINYCMELIEERLESEKEEQYITQRMQDGMDNEGDARSFYESITGNFVEECGFIPHPTMKETGSSPDGIFFEDGKKGVLEIKCPGSKKHLYTVINGFIPDDNIDQVNWHIICAKADFADFVSYRPHIKHQGLKGIIIRHYLTDEMRKDLETKAQAFLDFVDEMQETILSKIK